MHICRNRRDEHTATHSGAPLQPERSLEWIRRIAETSLPVDRHLRSARHWGPDDGLAPTVAVGLSLLSTVDAPHGDDRDDAFTASVS
jgi:hypothetical protein